MLAPVDVAPSPEWWWGCRNCRSQLLALPPDLTAAAAAAADAVSVGGRGLDGMLASPPPDMRSCGSWWWLLAATAVGLAADVSASIMTEDDSREDDVIKCLSSTLTAGTKCIDHQVGSFKKVGIPIDVPSKRRMLGQALLV